MQKLLPFIALLVGLCVQAHADTDYKINCKQAQEQHYEQQYCANKELGELNVKMKTAYDRLYQQTDAKKQLASSQKLWEQYSNMYCGDFMRHDTGGSPAFVILSLECSIRLTKERLELLQNQL